MVQNFYKDTETADLLYEVKKHQLENQAGNTSGSNFTPHFIAQFFNSIEFDNAVTLNNNKHEFTNTVQIANTFTNTEQDSGTFLIDTALIDFSDVSS